MAEDADFALKAAEQADVTVQEIAGQELRGGEETYPVRRLGSHGLTWVLAVAPSQRDMTLFLALVVPGLVTLAAIWIGLALARRGRRRRIPPGSAVSPSWLIEHAYDERHDE